MYRIRYYSQFMHPDEFGKGFLGLIIRCTNWLRWRLEARVQRLVLLYLAREGSLPKNKVDEALQAFRTDDWIEQVEKKTSSPMLVHGAAVPSIPREDMYYAGVGIQSALEAASEQMPVRPRQPHDMIAMYMDKRTAKYARTKFVVIEEEFEGLGKAG